MERQLKHAGAIIICVAALLLAPVGSDVYAQSPGGGRPGGRPGGEGGGRPMQGMPRGEGSKIMIERFPDIPGLTVEQRADMGVILTKEQENVGKLMQKRRQLMDEANDESLSQKKRDKLAKNIAKTDNKIEKQRAKSDKKIKKILTNEQYSAFIEKRNEIQFSRPVAPPQFGGNPDEMPSGRQPGRQGGGRPGGGGGRR